MKRLDKILFFGDKDEAKKLRGLAQSQLNILENFMSFRKLKQCGRVLDYDNGVKISCSICFGMGTAEIYFPPDDKGIPLTCCVIQIIFMSVETNSEFTDFVDTRIAGLTQCLNWMDHLKDSFYPAYMAHANNLLNYTKTFVFGFYPVAWNEIDVNSLTRGFSDYFEDTLATGKTKWQTVYDGFEEEKEHWQNVKTMATTIADNLTCTVSGNSNPAYDIILQPIEEAVITISCDLSTWEEPEYDFTGYSKYQIDRVKNGWGVDLWESGTTYCAPVTTVNFQTSGVVIQADVKGFVNRSTGKVHIVASNHYGNILTLDDGWLETLKFVWSLAAVETPDTTDNVFLSYPTETEYTISDMDAPVTVGPRDPAVLTPDFVSNFSVTGSLFQIPSSFGAAVGSWSETEWGLAEGKFVEIDAGYNFFVLLLTTDGAMYADLHHNSPIPGMGGSGTQEQ